MALRPILLTLLTFLLAAPAAHASTAELGHGALTYTAAAGEANSVNLYVSGTSYVIEDAGVASITVRGRSCHPYSDQIAYCDAGKVHSVSVSTGDGDDAVQAENGIVEELACGEGADSVVVDATDVVAADCFPDPAPEPEPEPEQPLADDPPAADEPDPAPVAVSSAPVTMDARGNVPVEVSCPATAADGCAGRVTLSLPHAGVGAARRSARVLGRSRRFKLRAGATRVVPVRLSRRSARIIRTRGGKRRRVKLAVTVEVTTASETRAVTSTITVTLRRSARARRR
jgi:hypothetical protein